MPLKTGTYARERDGAWHLYHSTETCWNDASYALNEFVTHRGSFSEGSLWWWRKVEDQSERNALREFLASELLPGENVVVQSQEAHPFT